MNPATSGATGRCAGGFFPAMELPVLPIDGHGEEGRGSASNRLASLVTLMQMESAGEKPGGYAVLNALSSALFTQTLRAAREPNWPGSIVWLDGLAVNQSKMPAMTTEAVAGSVGYESVLAFRRAFIDKTGITLGQWRRLALEGG